MKGVTLPIAMISVMVGIVLIGTIIIPLSQDAGLGTLFSDETVANSTVIGATTTNYTVTGCTPVRTDSIGLTALDGTTDVTSEVAVVDATNGIYAYTNTTTTADTSLTMSYRCTGDSAYITNLTARNLNNFIIPLVLVLVIVGLSGLMYFRR